MKPVLRQIANLWTLIEHPSREREWTLDEKLLSIRGSGFDGVGWGPSPELTEGAKRHGLVFVGGMATASAAELPHLLTDLKLSGTKQVNVQLGTDSMLTADALPLCLELMRQAAELGLQPVVETHRGTCTETPEKMYALADAYEQTTGKLLPVSWDFSHFAVVKHLAPETFKQRLLVRRDLIQHAQHFHLRPFNGHHAQVPITDARGELTREVMDWLPFAEATLACWLEKNGASGREIFVCPELGPVQGGYALSSFPNSWEDAKVLRAEIDRIWKRLTA
jgi:hypothetical protein